MPPSSPAVPAGSALIDAPRRRIWRAEPRFTGLAALNTWLEARCKALWQEIAHPEQPSRTITEVWTEERSEQMATPPAFDGKEAGVSCESISKVSL